MDVPGILCEGGGKGRACSLLSAGKGKQEGAGSRGADGDTSLPLLYFFPPPPKHQKVKNDPRQEEVSLTCRFQMHL